MIRNCKVNENNHNKEILNLTIYDGYRYIEVEGDDIGIFNVRGIKTAVDSINNYDGESRTADEAIIEIHRSKVGEIELLIDSLNERDIPIIYMDIKFWCQSLRYYLSKITRKFISYRVTSKGDLRIYIGTDKGWYLDEIFETSPDSMYKFADYWYDETGSVLYKEDEQPYNYEDIIYEREEWAAKVIYASIIVLGNKRIHRNRLALSLSVLDLRMRMSMQKCLNICEYTYWDEEDSVYHNIRVDELIRKYKYIDVSDLDTDILDTIYEIAGSIKTMPLKKLENMYIELKDKVLYTDEFEDITDEEL